ncbi:hypothetical protein R5R35_004870 [Gryllus longicercus]|uniref:Uncharacterized protein n=1 Tax=Gryllus longicercus TaxID=2509291 RepID=A0AAN9YZ80_9ORTH
MKTKITWIRPYYGAYGACVANQHRYEETQKELNSVKGRHRLLEIGLKDREGIEARLKAKLSQAQKASESEKRKLQALKDHAASAIQTADSKLTELRREHEEEMAKLTDSLQEAKTQFRNEFGPYNELKVEVATLKKKYDYYKGQIEARLRERTPINP